MLHQRIDRRIQFLDKFADHRFVALRRYDDEGIGILIRGKRRISQQVVLQRTLLQIFEARLQAFDARILRLEPQNGILHVADAVDAAENAVQLLQIRQRIGDKQRIGFIQSDHGGRQRRYPRHDRTGTFTRRQVFQTEHATTNLLAARHRRQSFAVDNSRSTALCLIDRDRFQRIVSHRNHGDLIGGQRAHQRRNRLFARQRLLNVQIDGALRQSFPLDDNAIRPFAQQRQNLCDRFVHQRERIDEGLIGTRPHGICRTSRGTAPCARRCRRLCNCTDVRRI